MSINIDPMAEELARLNAEVEALHRQRDLAFGTRDEAVADAERWHKRALEARDALAKAQRSAERAVSALVDIIARAAAGLGGSTSRD